MSRQETPVKNVKVCLIGQPKSGKSNFLNRYVRNSFNDTYKTTIGVDFALKTFGKENSSKCKLLFWDVGGEELLYRSSMLRVYCKETHAMILFLDLSEDLEAQMKNFEYLKNIELKDAVGMVVFSKSDTNAAQEKIANPDELAKIAIEILESLGFRENNIPNPCHFITSARNNIGLHNLGNRLYYLFSPDEVAQFSLFSNNPSSSNDEGDLPPVPERFSF